MVSGQLLAQWTGWLLDGKWGEQLEIRWDQWSGQMAAELARSLDPSWDLWWADWSGSWLVALWDPERASLSDEES